jgi:signal transduction histidine kinase
MMPLRLVSMPIAAESDIVAVRQRARLLAEQLQLARQDQTRIATAVSEIARNAFSYGNGGRAEFFVDESDGRQRMLVRIIDQGTGVADLEAVLEGRYKSPLGLGVGITGARKLLDHFKLDSSSRGTTVELGQYLPASAPRLMRENLSALATTLVQSRPESPLDVVREQNRELLESLEDLQRRQEEADRLGRELEDTNRGVVALYAELDARAEALREASEIKSRFLSNMSHEFRTPLNSILALSRMLLDGIDGDLSSEQQRQIGYIRKSAQELLEMVGDLLDLAKVEAGKLEVRPQRFTIAELFSLLRGALKPLRQSGEVDLVFDSGELPDMFTDEGKVAQILRNLISNALKFTEVGEVHVSGHHDSRSRTITFAVSDTGIGIAPTDQERIFEEFSQVEGRLQKNAKGTGLGLPLSRKLAGLLGGELWVESEVGCGTTFFLCIPIQLPGHSEPPSMAAGKKRVLVVDDDETFRYVLRQCVAEYPVCTFSEARDGVSGLECIRKERPDLVILDLQMPRMNGFEVLEAIRADATLSQMHVIVCTSLHLDQDSRAPLLDGVPILQKHAVSRERMRALLQEAFRE